MNVNDFKSFVGGLFRWYMGVLLVLLMFFYGCRNEEMLEIAIVSTNDIHGNIEQFPKLATFVSRVKACYPEVILVDAGDRFTGNPYVDYAKKKGWPIISLMNDLGYEVGALGNHEFDFGQQVLQERINDASFPMICANIDQDELTGILPSYVIERVGVKLGFFSLLLLDEDQLPKANSEYLKGLHFDHYLNEIENYKKYKDQCDVLIGLTHLGVADDSVLAMQMPELDMIIGGHSHTLLESPKIVNDVLIGQSGIKLQYAGLTILKFKRGKLVERSYRSCLIDTITQVDSSVFRKVKSFMDDLRFQEVIGEVMHPFVSKESIGNVVTDAMVFATGADFAFYNQGGIRVTELPKGKITRETVLLIEPFGNRIVLHDLSLDDIKALILNCFNRKSQQIDLLVAPGAYTIILDQQGNGVDVVFKGQDGRPWVEKTKYRVALNNYVSMKYDFPGREKGVFSDIFVVDAMVDYIRRNTPLSPSGARVFVSDRR